MDPDSPNDWGLAPLGDVTEVLLSNVNKKNSEDETPVRLCNYMDVYSNYEITPDLDLMTASATPAQIEKFKLQVGDVMITKDSEDPADIAVPAVVTRAFQDVVVCGYHLALLRPTGVDGNYLAWALRSRNVNDQFVRRANGTTRFGLTSHVIRAALIPLPPLGEQKKIAAVLSSVLDTARTARRVIEQAEIVKRGLMQDLLTGRVRVQPD
jgi:type I restriction enzyme, S subunit